MYIASTDTRKQAMVQCTQPDYRELHNMILLRLKQLKVTIYHDSGSNIKFTFIYVNVFLLIHHIFCFFDNVLFIH